MTVSLLKLLILAPGRTSRGDAAIAADLARQLPRKRVRVGFLSAAGSVPQLHDLGMPALPLDGETPAANVAVLDRVMRSFRPDAVVAADAFAVEESRAWSGLTVEWLRERYDCPVGSIDRLGWQSAGYTADFYGGAKVALPPLLDGLDLVIRPCPPHSPVPVTAGGARVVPAPLHLGGLGGLRPPELDDAPRTGDRPVVFVVNSEWEHRNPRRSVAVARLIDSLPRILHSQLAALNRPLQVVHVGPRPWRFPLAEQIEYRHFLKMPYAMFHARLAATDLFLTTNTLSSTLGRAVLAGVPSLVLQNGTTLPEQAHPDWLRSAAPQLGTAYPFRVAPLGWHDVLTPLLTDNPYRDCFAGAEIFDRDAVSRQLTTLFDGGPERQGLLERQAAFRDQLAALPQPLDALREAVTR